MIGVGLDMDCVAIHGRSDIFADGKLQNARRLAISGARGIGRYCEMQSEFFNVSHNFLLKPCSSIEKQDAYQQPNTLIGMIRMLFVHPQRTTQLSHNIGVRESTSRSSEPEQQPLKDERIQSMIQ